MFSTEQRLPIDDEFNQAETARSIGNEGKARVCARRAAGLAIRAYLGVTRLPAGGSSAYDLLAYIQVLGEVPPRVKEAAQQLRLRVDPDHQLPAGTDLIGEARILVDCFDALTG